MSIGINIDFLSLEQKLGPHATRFSIRMFGNAASACGHPDGVGYDDVISDTLNMPQLQALYQHIGALLSKATSVVDDAKDDDGDDLGLTPSAPRKTTKAVPKTSGAYLRAQARTLRQQPPAAVDAFDDEDADDDGPEEIPSRAKTLQPIMDQVGRFVDRIANNKRRDPRRIACRFLEEAVELVLATGATTQNVWSSVADSIHNQALKASADGRTVFPSQLVETHSRMNTRAEIADVRLTLLDLCYVCGITEHSVIATLNGKFRILNARPVSEFVTDGQTFYVKKSHVNAPATRI